MNKKYSILGIGNAIIDILSLTDENFLRENNLIKDSMTLIDERCARNLANLQYEKISSGGSVANSISTISALGIKNTALIGKIGDDSFGKIFCQNLQEIDVDFHCQNKSSSAATAQSFILITPDGHRTMATFLGAASDIENEIDEKIIADAQILYLEGYLWDQGKNGAAIKKAIKIAKENQVKIAFTLSDSFCVARHSEDFLALISDLDILFANEAEIKSLLLIDQISAEKIAHLNNHNSNLIVAITRSDKGALILDQRKNKEIYEIDTIKINPLDTTGAGDAFAAGFLYGIIQNYSLSKSAKIGNLLAGEVIKKIGARLNKQEISKIKYEFMENSRYKICSY